MDLHRSGRRPDWEKIKTKSRNVWQQLAARTNGLVTPGNFASLVGFILVAWGAAWLYRGDIWSGVILVIIGRLFDLVDGTIADKTGTKSPLGEAVDATIDKLEIVIILPILALVGILPGWQIAVIALFNIANATFAGVARWRGVRLHSSRLGKYTTALQWLVIVIYGAGFALSGFVAAAVVSLGHVIFGLVLIAGTISSLGYAQAALGKSEKVN